MGRDGRTINTANIGVSSPQVPAPQYQTCDQCRYFEDGICDADGSEKMAWDMVCEDFAVRGEERKPFDVPPPDYDKLEPDESWSKKPKTERIFQNRDLKNCITVHLPPDNPQLFAIELREHWDREYLKRCIEALNGLLDDDE